jgi:hypothetical protein
VDEIERARALAAGGNRRAALTLLREAAERDGAPPRFRLALAELYRELRNPDQAGRWGIVFEGWTTDHERDRLARLLAASGVDEESAEEFLRVPAALDGAADLSAVLASVPAYRERFQARSVWSPVPALRRGWLARLTGAAAKWLLFAAGLAAIITMVGVFQQTVTRDGDIRAFAIGWTFWFVGLLAASAIAFGGSRLAQRGIRSGLVFVLIGAVLVAFLIAALTS